MSEVEAEIVKHEEPKVVIARTVKDDALIHLVTAANAGALFSITIVVDGQVIYGDLISGKVYCEKMYEKFLAANGDKGLSEAVGNYFKLLGENIYTKDDLKEIPLNYMHLNNYAFLRSDGGCINMDGPILRVSIEKISAFSLGRP